MTQATRITWRHRGEYLVFRWLVCLLECLPVAYGKRLVDSFVDLVMLLPGRWTRAQVVEENLRRVFGEQISKAELDHLRRAMWRHLLRMMLEVVQTPRKLHIYSYRQLVEFEGLQATNEVLLSGRQFMLLGGHFGNWEIGLALFGLWGFPLGIVAREMDNPLLHAWFQRYRQRYRHVQIGKRTGYDALLERLQRGGNVGLLGDQDAGSRGIFVDFFGHPASTFKSIALLALEYDIVIIVGCTVRLSDQFPHARWSRFRLCLADIIDPRTITSADPVREITERYTRALEQLIRRYPDQYFWLHRRWKTQPRQKRVSHRQAA
ncbi:MAG: lipid A biosynthesis lauroyl acyltransferase [Planctomycetaceae bacterium]|nr:MAG: lipid A biosynthesis lauroyl acyltransferase [Planctomycetaceae bacterium]